MALNCHFALKSVSGSATNEFGVSGFRTKLFEHLQSYPYTVSDKNVGLAPGANISEKRSGTDNGGTEGPERGVEA